MTAPYDPLDPNPDPEMEYGLNHTGWARQPLGWVGAVNAVFDHNTRYPISFEPHPPLEEGCRRGRGSYSYDEKEAEEGDDPDCLLGED